MGAAGAAVLVLAAIWMIGRVFATQWLMSQYLRDAMTDRTLAIALIAVLVVPWLLIVAILLMFAPSIWWLLLILVIATWPMIVLPAVATYHEARRHQKAD